jgi:hypothetical protein
MRLSDKAKAIGATLCVVGVVGVAWWGYGRLNAEPSFVCDTTPVVAGEGATLWGIAEAKCEGDIREATDEAYRIFGSLSVGELVVMPEREGCRLVWVGKSSPVLAQDCR